MTIGKLFALRRTPQMREMQKLDHELKSLRRTYKTNRTDTALVTKLVARSDVIAKRQAVLQSELGVVRPLKPLPYNADEIGLGLRKEFHESQSLAAAVRLSEKPAKWDDAQKYHFSLPVLLETVLMARIDGVAYSYDPLMGFQQYDGTSSLPKRTARWSYPE